MTTRTPFVAIGGALVIALLLASCDSQKQNSLRTPVSPSPPSTPTPTPSLVRLELIAPGSIAPGESVQLTAKAVKSDSSVESVTEHVQWYSSDPRVLEIGPTGLARGIAPGEAVINGVYLLRNATTRIFVLPRGTYRLSGRVLDGDLGLGGATVTVQSGVGEGLTATTASTGAYVLYGVSGHIRLHAKQEGYLNRIDELDVFDHRSFDVQMTPAHPRADVRGTYTLTITRNPCSADLPEARSYGATVAQDGWRLSVLLSGADFIVTRGRGNGFSGVIDGADHVTFTIGDAYLYYYYYGQYDIVERMGGANALIISGQVTAAPSSSGISGTLNGAFLLAQGTVAPFTRFQARCYGTADRFEMVRR